MRNRKNALAKKRAAGEITVHLKSWKKDHTLLRDHLVPHLRVLAKGELARERDGCSLSSDDLVNEAMLKLLPTKKRFKNRKHFFGSGKRAMQQVLVERARRSKASKRGPDYVRVDFAVAQRIGFRDREELLQFNMALASLERTNPLWSEAIRLHIYEGYTMREIAVHSNCCKSTVQRRLKNAFEWLSGELRAA